MQAPLPTSLELAAMHGSGTRRSSRILAAVQGIRFRATISTSALLVVVSVAITLLFFQAWERSQRQAARTRTDGLARLAARAVAESVEREDPARMSAVLEALQSSGIVLFEVRGRAGPLLVHDEQCPGELASLPPDGDLAADGTIRRATRTIRGTTYLEVVVPVVRPGAASRVAPPADAPLGSVRLVATAGDLLGPTGAEARRTLLIAVTLVILGFLGTTFVAGSLVGPIQDLARTAERAVEGRVVFGALASSNDEIGVLARSLERTTDRIREARIREEQWDRELAQRIRQTTRELRQTNDHLTDIVENLGASVLVADLDGTITTANSAVAHIFGHKSDRVLGRNLAEFACAPGLTGAALRNRLEQGGGARSYEGVWRVDGGPERRLLIHHCLVRNFHGEPGAILQVAYDVTELGRPAAPGDVHRPLDAPRGARRDDRPPEPVDLDALVTGCVELVRSRRRFEGVELALQRVGDPVRVLADPLRIRQVIHSLLSHAAASVRDRRPHGGLIRVETFRETGEAGFRVTADGIGSAEEEVSQVFEPRVGDPAAGPGSGLAASHHVVAALGGRITVRAVPGEGATLTIRLPLLQGGRFPTNGSLSRDRPSASGPAVSP